MLMTIKQPCGAFIQKQGRNQCLQGLNGYRFNIKCQFGSVCPRVCVLECCLCACVPCRHLCCILCVHVFDRFVTLRGGYNAMND